MPYDCNLIKITAHPEDGTVVVDAHAFFAQNEGLKLPAAFEKELERLSCMPYSDDLADKIRSVVRDGCKRASQEDVVYYALHSTVRGRHNRTERAQAPQHARFTQYVLPEQRRLIRGRPTMITEAELLAGLAEFKEFQKNNLLEVRTVDGRLLNLDTFEAEAAAPQPLEPHPVLDSVANDTPTGIAFPRFQGDKLLTPDQVGQVVGGMASADGELKVDPKDGTAVVIPEGTEPPVEEPEVAHEPADDQELAEEEELEEMPPGIPPPPPPPGGMPRPGKKHKNRR